MGGNINFFFGGFLRLLLDIILNSNQVGKYGTLLAEERK
jgi:hypothetical protein